MKTLKLKKINEVDGKVTFIVAEQSHRGPDFGLREYGIDPNGCDTFEYINDKGRKVIIESVLEPSVTFLLPEYNKRDDVEPTFNVRGIETERDEIQLSLPKEDYIFLVEACEAYEKAWANVCADRTDVDWMPEAVVQAQHIIETANKDGSDLTRGIAEGIARWMETAAMFANNANYYRSIVTECGKYFGEEAYICDDGSKADSVLSLKVPDLVAKAVNKRCSCMPNTSSAMMSDEPIIKTSEEEWR